MACPTCDHTMHNVGQNDRGDNFFLCPRCGTAKIDAFGQHGDKVYVPKLVERCREFSKWIADNRGSDFPASVVASDLHRLGIAESINLPAERK